MQFSVEWDSFLPGRGYFNLKSRKIEMIDLATSSTKMQL